MEASSDLTIPQEPKASEAAARRFEFNWDQIRRSPAFWPGVALLVGFLAVFWPLMSRLPGIWLGDDGYYSHGFLVPLISGYVIFRWWPRISQIKVKPAYLAVPLLLAVLVVARASLVHEADSLSSLTVVFALLFGIAFVAGWRWMFALALPTLYLLFALPIWNMAITAYTNPLQVLSTKIAFRMLGLLGFAPMREENFIYLSGAHGPVSLDVGVPCSGFKLVLALSAFTLFFMLIANLKWWANAILVLITLPLALFINGLRIMMIGVWGVNFGVDAMHQFHDWSGYIALLVCFFVLFKLARWLGWKD